MGDTIVDLYQRLETFNKLLRETIKMAITVVYCVQSLGDKRRSKNRNPLFDTNLFSYGSRCTAVLQVSNDDVMRLLPIQIFVCNFEAV